MFHPKSYWACQIVTMTGIVPQWCNQIICARLNGQEVAGKGQKVALVSGDALDRGSAEAGISSRLDTGRNPFEEAIRQLVGRIRSGELPAGTRLAPERELSEELGISRSTLRELSGLFSKPSTFRPSADDRAGALWSGALMQPQPGRQNSATR